MQPTQASRHHFLIQLPVHLPVQFFTVVAMPMYQSFCSVFPGCISLLEAVTANYNT